MALENSFLDNAAEKSTGLLDVGLHCELEGCYQLDFLPFVCPKCKKSFCSSHQKPADHACVGGNNDTNINKNIITNSASKPNTIKPSLNKPSACAECKTVINTPKSPSVRCSYCHLNYCLKHRIDHKCNNLKEKKIIENKAKEKNIKFNALSKFTKWAQSFSSSSSSSTSSHVTSKRKAILELKKLAVGDLKVPPLNRIYVFVDVSTEKGKYSTSAKFKPIRNNDVFGMFFDKKLVVGKVLDKIAQDLQILNYNNSKDKNEDKLRLLHIEGSKLLLFGDKIGECGVSDGDTLALVRGLSL